MSGCLAFRAQERISHPPKSEDEKQKSHGKNNEANNEAKEHEKKDENKDASDNHEHASPGCSQPGPDHRQLG